MIKINNVHVFNTPEEIGVRILFVLSECQHKMSLQRLMYYDYLSLHLSDINAEYISLHPSNPHHSSEIAVKREIIRDGINLMINRGLMNVRYTRQGIFYERNQITDNFTKMFDSSYSSQYKANISIIKQKFLSFSDNALYKFVSDNIGNWAGEFEQERFVRTDFND
ncbi:MAG: ABC-three component system middle component 2 [Veillonellales bacterium]